MKINFWKNTDKNLFSHLKELNIHELTIQDIHKFKQRTKLEEYDNYIVIFLRHIDFSCNEIQNCIIYNSNEINFISNIGCSYELFLRNLDISKLTLEWIIWKFLRIHIEYTDTFIDDHKKEISDLEEKIVDISSYNGKSIFNYKKLFGNWEIEIEDFYYMIKNLKKSNDSKYYSDLEDHSQRLKNKINKIDNNLDFLILLDKDVSDSRTNEINKILTMIATAFVPPTFICSVYGMNFINIPELHYQNAYFIFWIVSIIWFVGIYGFFKKKEWL